MGRPVQDVWRTELTRRKLFQVGVAAGAAAFLAACGSSQSPSPAASAAATAAPTSEGPTPAAPSASAGPTPAASPSSIASAAASGSGTHGGSLTVALNAEPDTLDPAATALSPSHDVMMQLYDTLVWLDPATEKFVPGLADSWTISPDGMAYTFKLKSGVTFADGTPFDANAVKVSFDRVISLKAPNASKLGPYTGTKVIDPQTAEIDLSAPFPALLDGLSQSWLAIVSPAAVQKYGKDYGRNPVGTGAFKFKEWVTNDHITVVRNDAYTWGPSVFTTSGAASLDQVVFKGIADNTARLTGLQTGDFDIIQGVPEANYGLLKQSGKYQMYAVPISGGSFVMFMNTEHPTLSDINVRKAILTGMDRKAYIDAAVFGLYPPAEGPLAPNTEYYSKKVEGMYPFDLAKAKSMLDQAGWVAGSDGIRAKNGQKMVMDYYTYSGWSTQGTAAQALLTPLGITVNVIVDDVSTWFAAADAGKHDFTNTAYNDSEPSGIQIFWTSKNYGGFNWSRIKDPQMDQLFAQQAVAVDPTQRASLFEQIQLRIMDQAWCYPLYQFVRLFGVAQRVQGFHTNVLAYMYLHDFSVNS
jgi:peptide/nickel transport system substrate-binding protein